MNYHVGFSVPLRDNACLNMGTGWHPCLEWLLYASFYLKLSYWKIYTTHQRTKAQFHACTMLFILMFYILMNNKQRDEDFFYKCFILHYFPLENPVTCILYGITRLWVSTCLHELSISVHIMNIWWQDAQSNNNNKKEKKRRGERKAKGSKIFCMPATFMAQNIFPSINASRETFLM